MTIAAGQSAGQSKSPEHNGSSELEELLKKPLRRWTDEERSDYVRREPGRASQLIKALIEGNTAELPDLVFAQRENGIVQKVQVAVTLRQSEGHINTTGDNWMVAAAGYRRLNQVSGIQIIAPDSISVEDKRQPNPYVQLDPISRMPAAVYCRKIAIGPSPLTGSLVATDVMLRFDLNLYLLESIVSKIKKEDAKTSGTPDSIGMVGLESAKPSDAGSWFFIKMSDIGGGIGWWINLTCLAVKLAMQEHVTRMKFAERVAQTMTERNALKAHPAMPAVINVNQGSAVVRMIGWSKDFDKAQLDRIRVLAQEHKLHEVVEDVKAVTMDNADMDEVDRLDADRQVQEEQTAESQATKRDDEKGKGEAENDQRPAEEQVATPQLVSDALKAKQRLVDIKGAKAARELLKSLEIVRIEEANVAQLTSLISKAGEIK